MKRSLPSYHFQSLVTLTLLIILNYQQQQQQHQSCSFCCYVDGFAPVVRVVGNNNNNNNNLRFIQRRHPKPSSLSLLRIIGQKDDVSSLSEPTTTILSRYYYKRQRQQRQQQGKRQHPMMMMINRNSIALSSQSITKSTKSSTQLNMCICIHCTRVTNCAAYHFVETKHEQPHMTDNPTFTPRDGSPTIHVNVRTNRDTNNNNSEELNRLWKEHKQQTIEAVQNNQQRTEDGKYVGSNVYDLSPQTTVEYDVVACADFIEEKDCWVRNMPDAIRQANPNFVPT